MTDQQISSVVHDIIAAVRGRGDEAVREYSIRFDDWDPESFRLTEEQIASIVSSVPQQILDDIRFCQEQVRRFAEVQRSTLTDIEVETLPGIRLGHKNIPVGSVGAYVPGGRYPMVASAHMSVTTAKVAGVERVVACTPPMHGSPPSVTVAAMHLAGTDEIFILGGVQAVAALAIGTPLIPRVDMIVGPGNAYVAEAKRQLFGDTGIDLLAGPTEILVIADETADARLVAADLLGQAEHGPDSPAALITTCSTLASDVAAEIKLQLEDLSTADVAAAAWKCHGAIEVVDSLDAAAARGDELAFEHVEIHVANPRFFLDRMKNYGALFLGEETTVAYGDKIIGTNHVLPTAGAARYTGGLWVGKFLKTVTYQQCDREASSLIAEVCARQCRIENFEAHARSCDVRSEKYAGTTRRADARPGTGSDQ